MNDNTPILATNTLFLVGYMGAGKSTVGRRLARLLKANFIDTDIYLENRFRKTVSTMFEEEGEEVFRNREKMALQELAGYYNAVISTGGGFACFNNNMQTMIDSGITVYLKYSAESLAQRLLQSTYTRPLLRGLNGDALLHYIEENLERREKHYLQAHLLIDCDVVCPSGNETELAKYILSLLTDPFFTESINS